MEIRKARIEDAKEISYVNAYSVVDAYRGIVPNEYLKQRLEVTDNKIKGLEKYLQMDNKMYVAIVDDKIVGMMSIGDSLKEEYPDVGEIRTLFILKEYQGLGIGKALIQYGFEELLKLGYCNVIISCLKDTLANQFYEHIGGIKVGEIDYKWKDFQSLENIYYYKDINRKGI